MPSKLRSSHSNQRSRQRLMVPATHQQQQLDLYEAGHYTEAAKQAETLTRHYPYDAFAWKALGTARLEQSELETAEAALQRARELADDDPEVYNALGKLAHKQGRPEKAISWLEKALKLRPRFSQARLMLIKFFNDLGRFERSLEHIAIAERYHPDRESQQTLMARKAYAQLKGQYFNEGLATYQALVREFPDDSAALSNLASEYRSIGRHSEAEAAFQKALELSPQQDKTYSNYLMAMHYNPVHSARELFEAHRDWQRRFAPAKVERATSDRHPNRRLRIGMISAGFRIHPVGQMITSALEHLPRNQFELIAYVMSDASDALTERLQQRMDEWSSVTHLSEAELAQRIRDERIDILIDLCGHTEGNRLRTIAEEPAPLQVKWVGGLINTTGLNAMDYLISDMVETPPGVDNAYSEKLIRLPDDYICYLPRGDAPKIGMLPAYRNGYVTFGCFNNPSKINPALIKQWAGILQDVPGSRLLLKGPQYEHDEFTTRIHNDFSHYGIEAERLIFEGYSPHMELLDTYNRVDIALDPWPYSGGLTTCEALLMGVPVITYPGPSFAGRHAASHLINAGMPEFVTNSWAEYRKQVVGLANDLQSLSTIRTHLRDILLQSPVCDSPRFANHLTTVLRAIWQRYCEGKPPAALTLDKEGAAQFEDEAQPVEIILPEPLAEDQSELSWQFEGKIIILDNGATLTSGADAARLLKLGAFAAISFDPANRITNAEQLQAAGELHHYPHVVLGDGNPATLYACLDPAMSATLRPLQAVKTLTGEEEGPKVLAELPISTIQLDKIEGLESIDWLILDNMNDSLTVLEHGEKALTNTLLIQARVNFQPTHEKQPELTLISHWMARHGFSFYRLNEPEHLSHLPKRDDLAQHQATQLASADAIYVPNAERMAALSNNQRMKLAFILNTAYGIKDLAYALIKELNTDKSERYLIAENLIHTELQGQPKRFLVVNEAQNKKDSEVSLPDAPFMTENERALFKKSLKRATRYFEFGSGGSTVWAVEQSLTVHGVESDAKWVNALEHRLGKRCQVKTVEIGPTREWGYPVSQEHRTKFPDYSRAIHEHEVGFDLILVDGRFRVACTIAAIQHCLTYHENTSNARIFIHDFWNRPQYHVVLEFLDPIETVESAGVFHINKELDPKRLEETWAQYAYNPA